MGNTAGGSVESGYGHLELAGGPEFLLWQEDLPLRNMVKGMGEPKEEEELNVYMLLGRSMEGGQREQRCLEGGPVCQSPSSFKCQCLLSPPEDILPEPFQGHSLEVHPPHSHKAHANFGTKKMLPLGRIVSNSPPEQVLLVFTTAS